jgi:hypothetical protein
MGDAVLASDYFNTTDYYKNAATNIALVGFYFDAQTNDAIVAGARRFIACFKGVDQSHLPRQAGQSEPSRTITVKDIKWSDCLQIVDGHHRAAISYVRGDKYISAITEKGAVATPLQEMLLKVSWLNGRKELYQPVDAPELKRDWVLVRRCDDRLNKMLTFLRGKLITDGTYLDVAASYGWFVAEMTRAGFDGRGVERDQAAIDIGTVVYDLPSGAVQAADCIDFLRNAVDRVDVVSCFSLLHHYLLNTPSSAVEVLQLLDRATRRVLFLDIGQSHERWYKDSLPQWDVDYAYKWLKANTTFTSITLLGPDSDNVPPFADCFGRMMFACER